jgi:hypothetical protein
MQGHPAYASVKHPCPRLALAQREWLRINSCVVMLNSCHRRPKHRYVADCTRVSRKTTGTNLFGSESILLVPHPAGIAIGVPVALFHQRRSRCCGAASCLPSSRTRFNEWSSPVACQAHNLKVASSNLARDLNLLRNIRGVVRWRTKGGFGRTIKQPLGELRCPPIRKQGFRNSGSSDVADP